MAESHHDLPSTVFHGHGSLPPRNPGPPFRDLRHPRPERARYRTAVAKGHPFPPTRSAGWDYTPRDPVEPVYTSVASAVVLNGTTTEYRQIIEELAER